MEENFIFAGFGGQGVLLAGKILANAFMLEGKNVTWYPSYGAEMRGGTVNCEIVVSKDEVSSCDIPFTEDLCQFSNDYLKLTKQVADTCENHDLTDCMVIGTSALAQYEIDGAVGMYSGVFNNPFLIWGKYKKRILKTTLTVSFQFHHTQMDGAHAAHFLDNLQKEIKDIAYICRRMN